MTHTHTHDDLVKLAARWLKRDHPLVITEMTSWESPDALGWKSSESTTLVECKVSRADFLADAKKFFRANPEYGMGNYRYYLCPGGLIDAQELPARWGLLYAKGQRVHMIRKAAAQPQKRIEHEADMLISAIRRIGQEPVQGVSVKFYTYETKNRASMYLRIE